MAELPLEELLSAYLDGELTADERARAERLLADSPQAQRILEEMRAVGTAVQRLPRLSLPTDFCLQVLRRAERRMLEQPDPSLPGAIGKNNAGDLVRPAEEVPWSERVRRPMLYSILAASVAMVIVIFNPDPKKQAPPRTTAMAPKAGAASGTLRNDAKEAEEYESATRAEISDLSISAPREATSEESLGLPAAAPGATITAPRSAASKDPGQDANERPAMIGKSAGQPGLGAPMPGRAEGGLPTQNFEANRQIDQAASDGLLVVECEISPSALKNDALERVLQRQQVEWRYAAAADDSLRRLGDRDESGASPVRRSATESLEEEKASTPTSSMKLLYVEATPQQMERTLEELSSQPNHFLSVTVDPFADGGVQQRWQNQYSRRRMNDNVHLYSESSAAPDAAPPAKAGEKPDATSDPQVADKRDEDAARLAKSRSPARPADVADLKAEPTANVEPAGAAERAKKGAPSTKQTESSNNLGRARSYSIPQQRMLNRSAGAQQQVTQQQVAEPQPTAAPKQQQQAASQKASDTSLNRELSSESRLRALFVLQLPETPAAASAPAEPPAASESPKQPPPP
jgi:anti-sigma factor RsiW